MFKAVAVVLESEVVIARHAKNGLCGLLGEPGINISQGVQIIVAEAAHITAMNQNIARRN